MPILPQPLNPGDTVAIVATARKVAPSEIASAVKLLQQWGLHVLLAPNLYASHNQFAGTDTQRATDLQWAIDNSDVKAILCARGGYGSVRIIDLVNFSPLLSHPKWIIGYSDVTVLHSHLHHNFQLASLHATMPINIPDDAVSHPYPSTSTLQQLLFFGQANYSTSTHPLNRSGQASATLVGGNLSILYSLCSSPSDIDTNGKILLIEDLDEYLYHIDRMMQNLKRSGKLSGLKGLVVGPMSDMHDNSIPFGSTAEQIILHAVKDYDYPVCFNAPFGHIETDNCAIALGAPLTMRSNPDGSFLLSQQL